MALFRSGGGGRIVDPRRIKKQDPTSPRRAAAPRPPSVSTPARTGPDAVEGLESRTLLSTYYVSTSGSDSADGQSLSSPFKTIQQAANVAEPGDTVLVRGGTYRETVTPAHSGTSSGPA